MISVVEAISDLLFVRDTVVVPGMGAFIKRPTSAKVNPVANYFSAPACDMEFNANLREDNDLIVNYMVERGKVSPNEAKKQLVMFVSECFNNLKQGKKVELTRIGTLSYDWDNNLVFVQDKSVNYNADAFGLCDFTPQPVIQSKSKDEIKAEIDQQQKEKNTPVTVDEEAVHQDEGQGRARKKGRWIAVAAAVVLLFGLFYFNVDRLDLGLNPKDSATNASLSQQASAEKNEEVLVQNDLPLDTIEPVVIDSFRIIAGCYDREEFAQRIVNSLQTKGFEHAYKEKRGERWYVAYGWYPTEEEAVNVLREIRESDQGKGWILK